MVVIFYVESTLFSLSVALSERPGLHGFTEARKNFFGTMTNDL